METTKIKCTKCKIIKTIDNFSKNKSKSTGYNSICKNCDKIYKEEYRKKNKKKIAEGKKEHYLRNKETILFKNQEWKTNNKDKIKENSKKYYSENKDTMLNNSKKYYQLNKEELNRKQLEWNKTLKGKISIRNTHYRRKVKIKNGPTTNELLKAFKDVSNCYWCGVKIDKSKRKSFHFDHYIPLSKQGTHSIDNIVISCPSCNVRKSNIDPIEFANKKGRLL